MGAHGGGEEGEAVVRICCMREEKRKRNLLYPLFNPTKDKIFKKMHYAITTSTFTVKTPDIFISTSTISDTVVAIPTCFPLTLHTATVTSDNHCSADFYYCIISRMLYKWNMQ